jgi:proteasome lid subunit RPN8/RPN11
MHSHTYTEAYPSPTDVDDASRFDPLGTWFFVIVTLKDLDPSVRAYRILDGEITEVRVATPTG